MHIRTFDMAYETLLISLSKCDRLIECQKTPPLSDSSSDYVLYNVSIGEITRAVKGVNV